MRSPFPLQFTSWVDAVIFVFSLENEASFSAIYNYYVKMSQFRNMQEIPLILVGTQGKKQRDFGWDWEIKTIRCEKKRKL